MDEIDARGPTDEFFAETLRFLGYTSYDHPYVRRERLPLGKDTGSQDQLFIRTLDEMEVLIVRNRVVAAGVFYRTELNATQRFYVLELDERIAGQVRNTDSEERAPAR